MTFTELKQIAEWGEQGVLEYREDSSWSPYPEPFSVGWSFHQVENFSEYRRRPAAPKLRPWTADEAPMNCLLRLKKTPDRICVLAGLKAHQLGPTATVVPSLFGDDPHHFLSDLFTYHGGNDDRVEHSIDGGATWLPCGVLETPALKFWMESDGLPDRHSPVEKVLLRDLPVGAVFWFNQGGWPRVCSGRNRSFDLGWGPYAENNSVSPDNFETCHVLSPARTPSV